MFVQVLNVGSSTHVSAAFVEEAVKLLFIFNRLFKKTSLIHYYYYYLVMKRH